MDVLGYLYAVAITIGGIAGYVSKGQFSKHSYLMHFNRYFEKRQRYLSDLSPRDMGQSCSGFKECSVKYCA